MQRLTAAREGLRKSVRRRAAQARGGLSGGIIHSKASLPQTEPTGESSTLHQQPIGTRPGSSIAHSTNPSPSSREPQEGDGPSATSSVGHRKPGSRTVTKENGCRIRKCGICGTPGHNRLNCQTAKVNAAAHASGQGRQTRRHVRP